MGAVLVLLLLAVPASQSPAERLRAWVGERAGTLGGHEAIADCKGPRGTYRTRIAFRSSDGWARFTQWRGDVQTWDSVALGDRAWATSDGKTWTEGDADLRARIVDHQLLAMVLAPERVFGALGPPRTGRLGDATVDWVQGRDVAGHPVELAIASSGRPVAARITWGGPDGTLTIRWSSWERIDGMQLPREARIEQGADTFEFRFRPARLDAPEDAGWLPPRKE